MQQVGQQLPGDPRQPLQATLRGHQGPQLASCASQILAVSAPEEQIKWIQLCQTPLRHLTFTFQAEADPIKNISTENYAGSSL